MKKQTTTEAQLREWINEGKTHADIGQLLGRHPVSIAAACAVLGLSNGKHKKRNETAPITDYVAGLRVGMTVAEIAKKHGVSGAAVTKALMRNGLPTCARKLLVAEAAKQLQAA